MYCDTFLEQLNPDTDLCLGIVANRVTEEPIVDPTISNILIEYTQLEVLDNLGLTFIEYLDTGAILRNQYLKFLEELSKAKNAAYAELEESKNGIQGVLDDS